MKREDALVSLVRRFQEFGEVVDERRARLTLQVQEAQDAEARVQTELINQAKRLAREKAQLQVQAQCEERETERRKVQEVTKEEQEDKKERETKRQKVKAAIVKAQKLAWITAERERETKGQER